MALIFSNPPFNIFEERKTQKAPWSDFSWLDLSIYGQNIQYLRFPNRSFEISPFSSQNRVNYGVLIS